MQITTLTLCDAASVRENLLHVIGGGITNLGRSSFPAPLACDIGLFVSHGVKAPSISLTLTIREVGKKDIVSEIVLNGTREGQPTGPKDGFSGTPLALNARDIGLPHPGLYVLQASIDGGRGLSYNFAVTEIPEEAGIPI